MRNLILAAALTLVAAPALAEGGYRMPPLQNAAVTKECGACHMAFQPQFLPQRSWQAIMGNLSNHFGENAALPEATRAEIEAYMVTNASDGLTWKSGFAAGIPADQIPLRITELPKWKREHREIGGAAFTSGKVKTPANCVSCHAAAASGFFEDD